MMTKPERYTFDEIKEGTSQIVNEDTGETQIVTEDKETKTILQSVKDFFKSVFKNDECKKDVYIYKTFHKNNQK